jgi:hypothetical protein
MRLKYDEGLIKDSKAIAGETELRGFDALGLPYPLLFTLEMFKGKHIWMFPPK